MKKVAVTGASGHIGANLVRQLIQRGYKVVVLVRQSQLALQGLDIRIAKGDVTDLESLSKAFKGAEHVYHLAAYISINDGDRERLQRVNVEGTQNVIKACQAESVKTLIHFSSIHALEQQPLDQPVNEDSPLVTRRHGHGSDYDFSKAQSEILVREQSSKGLSTRILYPTAVVGPNDFNDSLFGQAIQKMAKGRLPALVSGGFDWVDARDVAGAAIEAAENGHDKERFLLSGHYHEMRYVADVIAKYSGVAAPGFSCPIWLARVFAPFMGLWAFVRNEEPLYTQGSLTALSSNTDMSHALATNRLGYSPRAFEESIKDALEFYQQREKARLNRNGN